MAKPLLLLLWFLATRLRRTTAEWILQHREQAKGNANHQNDDWFLETYDKPFDTIMDDSGDWFRNDYGPAFDDALSSFDTMRREFPISEWLTASLSARQLKGESELVDPPLIYPETIVVQNQRRTVWTLDATKRHTSGAILRNTQPLPDTYRIEYKLLHLDFGGKQEGSIVYNDNRENGYSRENGCKTQHPWGEGSRSRGWSGDASADYCDWQSVIDGPYGYNGFHFLSIVDFPDPAPRNNHFWHYRRKVLMDSFSIHPDRLGSESGGPGVCNAKTGETYLYRDSESWQTVNMWISGLPRTWEPNPGGLTGNSQWFMTTCNGGQATRGVQSAGELQSDFLPQEYYTFAIERNASGYTLEAKGNFARSGFQTLRFHRPFVVDDVPIWHYNVRPDEYDGRYNADLRQTKNWDFGSQSWPDQWPVGSSYPDFFVIGDVYTNVYEGKASLTDIRLYTDDASDTDSHQNSCPRTILLTENEGLTGSEVLIKGDLLLRHHGPNASLQLWKGTSATNLQELIWESGGGSTEQELNPDFYYVPSTLLQGDGNLITRMRTMDSSTQDIVSSVRVVWKSDVVDWQEDFYFVRECPANGGGVAIYLGPPGGTGIAIWQDEAISEADIGTDENTKAPTASTIFIPPLTGDDLDIFPTEVPSAEPTTNRADDTQGNGPTTESQRAISSATNSSKRIPLLGRITVLRFGISTSFFVILFS